MFAASASAFVVCSVVQAEQLRAGGGSRDRPDGARRAEDLRDLDVHDHAADFAADLVAGDERREEILAARASSSAASDSRAGTSTVPKWLTLPTCMSSRTRPWLNVPFANAASCSDTTSLVPMMAAPRVAPPELARATRSGLPAPRQLAGRESRRQQVVDAELRFRDDFRRQARVRILDERVRHPHGERRVRQWWRTDRRWPRC